MQIIWNKIPFFLHISKFIRTFASKINVRPRAMQRTLTEITLLNDNEFIHLETRHKTRFEYPLHKHAEIELNYIEHYRGLRRVIGDSVEECLGDTELVLIGPGLEHCWEEGDHFVETETIEVTIQFSPKLFDGGPFNNPNLLGVTQLLRQSQQGISFGPQAIAGVRHIIYELSQMEPGFYRFQKMLTLLYELSRQTDYRALSTEAFTRKHVIDDNQRIEHVVNYIHAHYPQPIRLEKLADIAYMSPTAFSHFFRLRTHKTVSDFIIDERIGHAIRLLVNTNMSILEICYACGFQNVSNFNRQFQKRRNSTPSQYRTAYKKAQTASKNISSCANLDEIRAEITPK